MMSRKEAINLSREIVAFMVLRSQPEAGFDWRRAEDAIAEAIFELYQPRSRLAAGEPYVVPNQSRMAKLSSREMESDHWQNLQLRPARKDDLTVL